MGQDCLNIYAMPNIKCDLARKHIFSLSDGNGYIAIYIVTYQDSIVTRQMNDASLLCSLIGATMKTNAS
jgi:hypothetical protein